METGHKRELYPKILYNRVRYNEIILYVFRPTHFLKKHVYSNISIANMRLKLCKITKHLRNIGKPSLQKLLLLVYFYQTCKKRE